MKPQKAFILLVILCIVFSNVISAQVTTVKGKLLDVNGNPSKFALVGIVHSVGASGKDFVSADNEGNYSISITKPGLSYLLFSMPSHNPLQIQILNEKTAAIEVAVRLNTYTYSENFDDVGIISSLNNYNFSKKEKMLKQEDGTYTLELSTAAKEFKYQLLGIEKAGRSINAPNSAQFEPDSSGDYRSVVPVNDGKVSIIFNPKQLLISDKEPVVVFAEKGSHESIYNISREIYKINIDASGKMNAHYKEKKSIQGFHYDSGTFITDLPNRIDSEKNDLIKEYLKLIYVSMTRYQTKDIDYTKATQFFESVEPNSPAWELVPTAFFAYTTIYPQHKWNELQDKFLSTSPSEMIKVNILSGKLSTAKITGDNDEFKRVSAILSGEYKDNDQAKQMLKMYPLETKIKIGADVPSFEVVSIDDSSVKFSKQIMLGKIYLIDFWATWCMPCVQEMKNLHSSYEKFKDKGFEILSLSMDGSAEDVIKFRNKDWKMPWKNSFIGPGGSQLSKDFEVVGIPKPILIGTDGKILKLEADLRGENLEKTLEGYFK